MDTMSARKLYLLIHAFALALLIVLAFAPQARAADTILVPTGATWKYLANGTDQGTAMACDVVQRFNLAVRSGATRLWRW